MGVRELCESPLGDLERSRGVVDPGESLLKPRFFFSSLLDRQHLAHFVQQAAATRPNCVRASESSPPKEMLEVAVRLRAERNLDEPMFRTLLRLRREPSLWTDGQ